ncbi:unnamed protein product [Mytilus edulis]|uniref:Paraneoplastic antigen Ma-like C-terminal domain-containing protein n=2 Tax=Mytilus TaxID=6548 RepID=A0A8S3T0S1_MYTED|nr:unnamed protein product [Mytilus edulis]
MAEGNASGSVVEGNVKGHEPNMSETDIAKMIAFLSKHGKYKVLTNEEYDLISYAKPLVKKEGSMPTGYTTSTPKPTTDKLPSRPPPPPPFRKYYHDFSGINEQVKPKVSFNLGNHTHDITGNTPTYQRPRLPVFSGDAKSEASFDVWKFEVKCLLRENLYPELIIVQCMRNSLKNQARNTLLTLPESATPHNILEKLEGIYGNVYSNETLLQSFYTEKQDEGQSVADYGMKLEGILQKAYDKGKLTSEVRDDMLRTKFWSGIRDSALKNATRYKYDTIKNFDELRKEVRAVELELQISSASKPTATVIHQPVTAVSDMNVLIQKLDAFNKRLDNFEGELKKVKESQGDDQQNRQNNKPQGSGNYWNNRGTQRGRYNNNYRGNGRGRYNYRGGNRGQSGTDNKFQNQNQNLNFG